MGLKLLDEALDSVHRLDSKAYAIAGFSGATLSGLLAIANFQKGIAVPFIAALSFLVSVIFALAAVSWSLGAIWPRSAEWFSPDEWLRKELLNDATELKKYYILCMYGARQSHRGLARRKAVCIRGALLCLCGTGLCLIIATTAMLTPLLKVTWIGASINLLWVAVR
jgi:hypothetical protein